MATENARLKDASPAGSHPTRPRPSRAVPWQIWVAVSFLGLECVGNLLAIPYQPEAASWLAAKFLFITGLIRGWRWVFVLFLAAAGLHVLTFSTQAPFVAFLNLLLVLLAASALRYFFPGDDLVAPPAGARRTSPGAFDRDFEA